MNSARHCSFKIVSSPRGLLRTPFDSIHLILLNPTSLCWSFAAQWLSWMVRRCWCCYFTKVSIVCLDLSIWRFVFRRAFRFRPMSTFGLVSIFEQIIIHCRSNSVSEHVLIDRMAAAVDGMQQFVSINQSSLVVLFRGMQWNRNFSSILSLSFCAGYYQSGDLYCWLCCCVWSKESVNRRACCCTLFRSSVFSFLGCSSRFYKLSRGQRRSIRVHNSTCHCLSSSSGCSSLKHTFFSIKIRLFGCSTTFWKNHTEWVSMHSIVTVIIVPSFCSLFS